MIRRFIQFFQPLPLPVILILCLIAGYSFVWIPWIFFATKPSFLSQLPMMRQIIIGLEVGGLVTVVLWALCFALWPVTKRGVVLIPAVVAGCTIFVAIDTFLDVLFKFGISMMPVGMRIVYSLFFLLLLVVSCRETHALGKFLSGRKICADFSSYGLLIVFVSQFLILSSLAGVWMRAPRVAFQSDEPLKSKPDVVLIGIDGLNANDMSLYGFPKKTTPFIDTFAKEAVVFENAFPNANVTDVSLPSILTGKTPHSMRRLWGPEKLAGVNAYRHLPGFFRRHGYRTALFGLAPFVDSNDWNMKRAFGIVNESDRWTVFLRNLNAWASEYWDEETRFVSDLLKRFFIRMGGTIGKKIDIEIWKNLKFVDEQNLWRLEKLANTTGPLFVHLHLLALHPPAPRKHPRELVLEIIETCDAEFRRAVDILKKSGRWDNAVVILYSDHGMNGVVTERLPLVFRFPKPTRIPDVKSNSQNIDIAPTILDYLGVSIPSDMDGVSLLNEKRDPKRPVFAGTVHASLKKFSANMIVCDAHYRLELETGNLVEKRVERHSAPCVDIPSSEEARKILIDYLKKNSYPPPPWPQK